MAHWCPQTNFVTLFRLMDANDTALHPTLALSVLHYMKTFYFILLFFLNFAVLFITVESQQLEENNKIMVASFSSLLTLKENCSSTAEQVVGGVKGQKDSKCEMCLRKL